MNDNLAHIDWDTLNQFADNALPEGDAEAVTTHIATCPTCQHEYSALTGLLGRLRNVPNLAEPDGLWLDIRQSITRSNVHPASTRWFRRAVSLDPRVLAAAATLLIVVTSSVTALLVRQQPLYAPPVQLQYTSVDHEYLGTVEALERDLARQRKSLRPETVHMVERSLATIDSALMEARTALLADPASGALQQMVASVYRQKVDFLLRANQIAAADAQ